MGDEEPGGGPELLETDFGGQTRRRFSRKTMGGVKVMAAVRPRDMPSNLACRKCSHECVWTNHELGWYLGVMVFWRSIRYIG